MRFTFEYFKNRVKENCYTAKELIHLFVKFTKMDKQSRSWVVQWVLKNKLPQEKVEQITASELVNKFGFSEINAIITLDWLKRSPCSAKYFLMKYPTADAPDSAANDAAMGFFKRHGKTPGQMPAIDDTAFISED